MAFDPESETEPVSSDVRSEPLGRIFLFWLLAITLASAVPRLILGALQIITYDGYWHLFISRHNDWSMWWYEVRADGHPPLFYLIQYLLSFLGHSHLLYRSASILPGVGATFVIGLIGAKLFRHRAVALLAALSYGFAMSIIDLTIDIRAYPMAIFFCLLAFYVFLEIIRDHAAASDARPLFYFGLFVSLAILNEYYSLLFFVSCLGIPAFYGLRDRRYRALLVGSLRRWRAGWLAAIGVPLFVTAVMYRLQMRFMPGPQAHLREFYWAPHSGVTLSDFLFKNLASELGYFFPATVLTLAGLTLLLLLTLPVLVNRLILRRDAANESLRGSPALILLFMLLELMFASATGHYPFGGLLRQQSIIAPFFTLTGFLLLDWILDATRQSWQRLSLLAVVALCIASTFVHSWRHYGVVQEELASPQYRTFQSAFTPQVIYSDFFSTFLYFLHTQDSDWHFERSFRQQGRLVLTYRVTNPRGQHLEFLRSRDDWNFDLSDPVFYTNLASDLRTAGLDSAVLFYQKQEGHTFDAAVCRANEEKFKALARAAGLDYGRAVYDGLQAYIEFRVRGLEPVLAIGVGLGALPEHLGDGWFRAENGIRWMGQRALVLQLGPATEPAELLVATYWPSTILAKGPVHVRAEAGGIALKPIEVGGKEGARDLRWLLPKTLSDRKSIDVVLEVDTARQYSNDPRTLGMAVSRIALETPGGAH
jgi:hypothetical protein